MNLVASGPPISAYVGGSGGRASVLLTWLVAAIRSSQRVGPASLLRALVLQFERGPSMDRGARDAWAHHLHNTWGIISRLQIKAATFYRMNQIISYCLLLSFV